MATRGTPALEAELIVEQEALDRWRPHWDRLAVATGRPFASPHWMLAWWRHARPEGSSLQVVIALSGEEVVGVVPLFLDRAYGGLVRCRVLAAHRAYRVEPVAAPGREAEVAEVAARIVSRTHPPPDLVMFEAISSGSPWPKAFADGWPGRRRPWLHLDKSDPSPGLTLEGSFDAWFSSKSRNFRQQMRRSRKQLRDRGAIFRTIELDDLSAQLAAFRRLHRARWEGRGGSSILSAGVMKMLRTAGEELVASGRFRLWTIEVDGKVISSHLFLAAGGEVAYWLGGFDEAWAAQHPSQVAILAAIEHAWRVGDRRVDLGWGGQRYKYRFANGEDTLEWWTLVPGGGRFVEARLRLLPKLAYRTVASHLPASIKERLQPLVRTPRWAR